MMQPLTISDAPEGFTDRVLWHAWNVEFRSALQIVPFALWNESVFRWHFVKSAIALYRDEFDEEQLRMQLEWNRFDLLVQEVPRERNHLIEFKCFVRNKHGELDGSEQGWKGGPGAPNYKEFEDCVEKLVLSPARHSHDFDERQLVVVYPDHPADWSGKRDYTYSYWYEELRQFNNPELNTQIVPHKRLPPIRHLHRRKPIELKCLQFKIVAPPQDA